MSLLEKALSSLRPDVAWELPGELLLENVIWPDGVVPPTQAEVNAEVARLSSLAEQDWRYKQASQAVKERIQALCEAWEYTDLSFAVAYIGGVIPKYDLEARVLRDWAGQQYYVFDQIRAGQIAEPATLEGLMALMPPIPERPEVPL